MVPLGTSTSKITSTSIPISSAIATPRVTNHTAGRTGPLPLCLAIAVTIGEAHASATSPPIRARSGDRRRPSKRGTPNAYTATVRATAMTKNGAATAIISARPI